MRQLTTALGGEEFALESGEKIWIRQVPIRLLPRLQELMASDDEPGMVELYCRTKGPRDQGTKGPEDWEDVPAGWSDRLSANEFTAIMAKAEEINADFFAQWQARRKRRKELLPKPDTSEVVSMLELLSKTNPAVLNSIVDRAVAGTNPKADIRNPKE